MGRRVETRRRPPKTPKTDFIAPKYGVHERVLVAQRQEGDDEILGYLCETVVSIIINCDGSRYTVNGGISGMEEDMTGIPEDDRQH